ncbi:hypothetical protein RF11_07615 [Thelohanellus kitauei]|uniref:Uncharacterized protein n=1 Tax=Thelohanellus kitauei TaxID=669202 RepID=A0A0C2N6F7_THEKT|nr:hypothetical protein RF11_07615 [Thelohanellus kitauei]
MNSSRNRRSERLFLEKSYTTEIKFLYKSSETQRITPHAEYDNFSEYCLMIAIGSLLSLEITLIERKNKSNTKSPGKEWIPYHLFFKQEKASLTEQTFEDAEVNQQMKYHRRSKLRDRRSLNYAKTIFRTPPMGTYPLNDESRARLFAIPTSEYK